MRLNDLVCLTTVLLTITSSSTAGVNLADEAAAPAAATASAPEDEATGKGNRLAKESSPYLLLHAHNPMDWYPWGPEAFDRAKTEGKPIFLSIGYSSCYWCHVMERQVFSNPAIAEFMNQHFVNIKVDREERPDVDDIYMTSLIVYQQAAGIGGGGGWPLSLFLTPEGNPIGGATYLPPEDAPDGRSGFLTIAKRVQTLWEMNADGLRNSAASIAGEVRRLSAPKLTLEAVPLNQALIEAAMTDVREHYDPVHGGVDFRPTRPDGPRFPSVPRLQLLLSMHLHRSQPELWKIVEHSLTAMASGGIRDHLAGGFHRYSTDRRWHVPHFEKMLYDQAQLLEVYSQAAGHFKNEQFLQVAGELSDFVQRELTLPDGGFCSALDAETNAIEGEYYVWSADEIVSTLGQSSAELFMQVYGMKAPNSFEHGFVLHLPEPIEAVAGRMSLTVSELQTQLKPLKQQLLDVRAKRPRPLLDDKVLTEWNAMMIQALAESGRLPGREGDLAAASKAADFLLKNLKDADGHLMRSWRNGRAVYRAYLDDYAFLASALLRLHEATGEQRWLQEAVKLTSMQIELFYDRKQETFFYTSHDHEQLIARTSNAFDSTFPSGNSVTIRNLMTITAASDKLDEKIRSQVADYPQITQAILNRFSSTLRDSPAACSGMAIALQQWLKLSEQQKVSHRETSRDLFDKSRPVLTRLSLPNGSSQSDAEPQSEESEKDSTTDNDSKNQDSETTSVFKPVFPEPTAAGNPLKDEKTERPVQAKVYPQFDKLERGGKCPVAVELIIDPKWHINSNPQSPEFLVPTELKIVSKQKIKMTRVFYPPSEKLNVPGSEPYHVYSKRVILYGILETDATETAETGELEIRIRYQACNESTCMPPEDILLKGKLPLANPGDPIRKIHEDKFPKPKPAEGSEAPKK